VERSGEVPSGPGVVDEAGRRGVIVLLQQAVEVGLVDRGIGVEEPPDCRVVSLTLCSLVVPFEQREQPGTDNNVEQHDEE